MEDPEERWPVGDWQAEGVLTEQLNPGSQAVRCWAGPPGLERWAEAGAQGGQQGEP